MVDRYRRHARHNSARSVAENQADPRVGVALRVPRLNWVLRAFYGHYYQPPPLVTATGPLLGYANSQDFTFAPLYGERDKQWEASLIIPYPGWNLEVDNYQTSARNWLDHNNIGELQPVLAHHLVPALIQGWDLSLRSPYCGIDSRAIWCMPIRLHKPPHRSMAA